jgi:hypothetical protein
MNPFETPMVSTIGFNATKSSDIALKKKRVVQGNEYPYFYNPMWSLFGDLYSTPSGTYFYQKAEHVNVKWNIFDQVLLRPSLIPFFEKPSLKIISQLRTGESLLDAKQIPDSNKYSDHLPIIFTLNIN